mgnify:CR=1 FL=1
MATSYLTTPQACGQCVRSGNSGEGHDDNTVYVQDAIIASNATQACTITLGEGAILRNFGGMSAVRVTNQAQLVMKNGSIIEDSLSITEQRGVLKPKLALRALSGYRAAAFHGAGC